MRSPFSLLIEYSIYAKNRVVFSLFIFCHRKGFIQEKVLQSALCKHG